MVFNSADGVASALRDALSEATGVVLPSVNAASLCLFAQSRGLSVAFEAGDVAISGNGVYARYAGSEIEQAKLVDLFRDGVRGCLMGFADRQVDLSLRVFMETATATWRVVASSPSLREDVVLSGLDDEGVDAAVRRMKSKIADVFLAQAQSGGFLVKVVTQMEWPWDRPDESHGLVLSRSVPVERIPPVGAVLVSRQDQRRFEVVQAEDSGGEAVIEFRAMDSGEPEVFVGLSADVLRQAQDRFDLHVEVVSEPDAVAPHLVLSRISFMPFAYTSLSADERIQVRRGFEGALNNIVRGFSELLRQQATGENAHGVIDPHQTVYESAVFMREIFPDANSGQLVLIRQGWEDAVNFSQRALREAIKDRELHASVDRVSEPADEVTFSAM